MTLPSEFQMMLCVDNLGLDPSPPPELRALAARCENGEILSIDYLPPDYQAREVPASDPQTRNVAGDLKSRLGDFFSRNPVRFDDLPVCASMLSLEEQVKVNSRKPDNEKLQERAKVREEVRAIPCGKVRSYKRIAEVIGWHGPFDHLNKVAHACSNSSLAIVVPCYRVVRAGMRLGDYSNGNPYMKGDCKQRGKIGRRIKCWLLRHEGWTVNVDDELDPSPDSKLSRVAPIGN